MPHIGPSNCKRDFASSVQSAKRPGNQLSLAGFLTVWLPGVEAADTAAKEAALHGDSSFALALGNDVFACLH
jgi:TctA family transporter